MEDISRELEKEIIASTRYNPVKRKVKSKFFLINDLGEIRSAAWLKTFLWTMSSISIIALASACLLYYLYSKTAADNIKLAANLAKAEKTIDSLAKEKEILAARLVISGKLPFNSDKKKPSGTFKEKKPADIKRNSPDEKKNITVTNIKQHNLTSTKKNNQKNSVKSDSITPGKAKQNSVSKKSALAAEAAKTKHMEPTVLSAQKPLTQYINSPEKTANTAGKKYNENKKYEKIEVEDFKITKNENTDELFLRFNIRNVSPDSTNISGRIFVILKPNKNVSSWLVVPGVTLKNGEPAVPRRGQYFSIAHFKAVNFRMKSNIEPGTFKKAAVFVYDKNKLIFMRELNINTYKKEK